jgi:hypothetical protein
MKVKIFEATDRDKVTAKANDFMRTVKVVDVQLAIRPSPNDQFTQYILLVKYED